MPFVELIAVLGAFSIPLYVIKTRHETRRLELEARARDQQKALPAGDDNK